MSTYSMSSVGDQQLTVAGTAVRLTPPSGKTPRHALIYVGTDSIRWLGGLASSTTPTAAIGILVPAGSYIDWTDPDTDYWSLIQSAQFIRVTASATLDIIYFT